MIRMEEEDFKKEIIIPTLRRLGFDEIRDNHGIREFGKDIIFSKFDEFGLKRFYAAQVKSKDINGRNAGDFDDVIGHAMRAFAVTFTDIFTKKEVSIDEFYVIISGRFLGNAIDIIKNSPKISGWSRLIHFIDGEFMQKLYSQNVQKISRLINETIRESHRNIVACDMILKNLKDIEAEKRATLIRLRNYNLERLLSEGILEDNKNIEFFYDLSDKIGIMNRKLELLLRGFSLVKKETFLREIPILEVNMKKLIIKLIESLPSYGKSE